MILFIVVALAFLLCGCQYIPEHLHFAPKTVEADGQVYLACEGAIWIYSPSRDIASSSSSKSYEVVFTDDYGHSRDLKDLSSYTVSDAADDAHYAMSPATVDNTTTAYSDGTPMKPGAIVLFGKGDAGRAIWNGPGKWSPVPCPK